MKRFIFLVVVCHCVIAKAFVPDGGAKPLQAPFANDLFTSFIYEKVPTADLRTFDWDFEFQSAGFQPWNGSYWPTHKGIIASRFADPGWPDSKDWQTNYNYYMSHSPADVLAAGQIDSLSPAEKYDLLSGDSAWTLTAAMWKKGQDILGTFGAVPTWFGICHGWSAANHMRVPEAKHPVTVTSADGLHSIVFFPSDIEALVSYLWAESPPTSVFLGARCETSHPKEDAGHVTDPACFDSNPATWHLSVLNRVGRDRLSLVMDSSAGAEVWNYAVDSYVFRYFDPVTLKPGMTLADAAVPIAEYYSDPFTAYRSPGTAYVVGVAMNVFMPAATEPTHYSPSAERLIKVKSFIYDLELDASFNAIGGEWRSKERPDFIWTFKTGTAPWTVQDGQAAGTWDARGQLPDGWAQLARDGSVRGKIMAKITNALVERAAAPEVPVPARANSARSFR